MPLLQKIELANFLNARRDGIWQPAWPHQVLDINGENAALNIPNGKGKSTMVTAILAMLTHHSKSLKETRLRHFAPVQHRPFSHIRILVSIPMPGASGDLIGDSGGAMGGRPMVFGMYGYSGENEEMSLYSYQGDFDDCPVAHVHGLRHTPVEDDVFLSKLKTCDNVFPSNAKERTKRAWVSYVEDFFDISSVQQQLVYQLMRGAEGGHGYFEVNLPAGIKNYSAAVFYERLAPELLTDVMGDLGEEGEHGIEDTIHEKVSKVISAKYETTRKAAELRRAENTLAELKGLLEHGANLKNAKLAYDNHRESFSVELAVLRDVVLDNPIPGIPKMPPESIPEIAKYMVMQDEKWFLSDRVMAEFTGESASDINRRAKERNGIETQQANNIQLIDYACHHGLLKRPQGGGKHAQLYLRESALALLSVTTNYTGDWTKSKAIAAVTQSFDWVEEHADTNPARKLRNQLNIELEAKNQEKDSLSEKYKANQKEREILIGEQSQVGAQQAEYRNMSECGLFTQEELAAPAKTGAMVTQEFEAASLRLDDHKDKVRDLTSVYEAWKAFVVEFGDAVSPSMQVNLLNEALGFNKNALGETQLALNTARGQRKNLENNKEVSRKNLLAIDTRLKRYQESLPATVRFKDVFGDVSPSGLEQQVTKARDQAKDRLGKVEQERNNYNASLKALADFRVANGAIDPAEWLRQSLGNWETLGKDIELLNDELTEARLRRAALDQAVIVAGRVAREAGEVAGGNQQSLHTAVAGMNLGASQKEKVLTLFSALLHTPVYSTVVEAAEAAGRLAQAGIETPVFVKAELEAFCRTNDISLSAISAHNWLVGVRTRQVDCLLDPSLVAREKEQEDQRIINLPQQIAIKNTERMCFSPESTKAAQARLAAECINNDYVSKDSVLITEQETLMASLPDMEVKASRLMLDVIRNTEIHQKEFAQTTEASLQGTQEECIHAQALAIEAFGINQASIEELESQLGINQEALTKAQLAANKVKDLARVQAFMDHPSDNPVFMNEAKATEQTLAGARKTAHDRTKFRFDMAELFIGRGAGRAQEIETRLGNIKKELLEIEDDLTPAVHASINTINGRLMVLLSSVLSIDNFVRETIRKYREFAADQDDLMDVSQERIKLHPLGALASELRDEDSIDRLIELLTDNNTQSEEAYNLKGDMREARGKFNSAKDAFSARVEKILVMPELDMTDHIRLELQRAIEQVSIVEHLYSVALQNYSKNQLANETAAAYLETEWENIGKWLKAFTQRLPDNLRTMKSVFGPAKDKVSGEYLSAGFEIEATLADQNDIKAILDDVVSMVEKYESTKRAIENAPAGIKEQSIRSLRSEIRNTFYHKVIANPRVKVYMPSISKKPLPLEKNMVSTGQGVAMTLLWIVKMAEYVTEREMRRQTTNRAKKKYFLPTQFAIMDGAFSSLSNKGLIGDALNSIGKTRGRFQLIITGHDENYQNNFTYFPTLVQAREINGQFMYADSETRRTLHPEDVGSHYGAMEVLNMRIKPKQEAEVT